MKEVNKTSMLYWYPKIQSLGVPLPKTKRDYLLITGIRSQHLLASPISFLRRCFCQFKIAIIAYKNTILNTVPLFRIRPDSPPAILDSFLFTVPIKEMCGISVTHGGGMVGYSSLIDKCSSHNPRISDGSHGRPPDNGWYQDDYGDYQLFQNGKPTGMIIFRTRSVLIPNRKNKFGSGYISLGRYYYRVSFLPNLPLNIEPITKTYHVIETSSLEEAKSMGEWYYGKWLKYNQGDLLLTNSIPFCLDYNRNSMMI